MTTAQSLKIRVGYACGPKEILSVMLKIHQYSILCAPRMGQVAALEALQAGRANDYEDVRRMRDSYDRRRRLMVDSFRKMGLDDWNAVIRTNLDSMFYMTKPYTEGMAQRGWGRIINIASINGQKGSFGQANYAAAKAGIHGFTMSLALEMARKGVTVNTISPGYLATEMVMKVPREILEEKVISQIPLGRLGDPFEIAALAAFMASDDAGFMTGANVAMNGGHHMQ